MSAGTLAELSISQLGVDKMPDKLIDIARNNGRRLVAPLMGFPGFSSTGQA